MVALKQRDEPMITSQIPQFLVDLEERFNIAMISNDIERIAECITDDWLLVTPEAGPVSRSRILDVVGSGRLTHSSMTKVATHAAVMGDMAWVTGRGQNTGTFNGMPIQADEYITDIYRKVGDTWLCMLTHLTPAQS
jgi:ketosteroid isomerase-like protein